MTRTFVESQLFTRRLESSRNLMILGLIQKKILENPEVGDVVQGTGGLRKFRLMDPTKKFGARGGLRVLYLDLPHVERAHLIYVYEKREKEDLTSAERAAFREVVNQIKREAK